MGILLIGGALTTVGCRQADADQPPSPTQGTEAPKSEPEKVIYTLGRMMAGEAEPFEFNERERAVLRTGFLDALSGRESRIAAENYEPAILDLAVERVRLLAAREKAAGAEFLAQEAQQQGASVSESGLVKRVLRAGDGPTPSTEDTVKFKYKGTLRDGTVLDFDGTAEKGAPATLPIARMMPCWAEALQTMQVGESARIACPSSLAYGDRGSAHDGIKPGAVLVFEMELLQIAEP